MKTNNDSTNIDNLEHIDFKIPDFEIPQEMDFAIPEIELCENYLDIPEIDLKLFENELKILGVE